MNLLQGSYSISQNNWSFVNNLSDYKRILSNPESVTNLYLNIPPEAMEDTYDLLDLRLNSLVNVRHVSFVCQLIDSSLEARLFNDLGEMKSLESLTISSHYMHHYNGFDNLKSLGFNDNANLSNPSLVNFGKIKELGIGLNESNKVHENSPVFDFQSVIHLELYRMDDKNFPFHKLSDLKNLVEITLSECKLSKIPESWSSLNLNKVDINYSEITDYSGWLCQKEYYPLSLEISTQKLITVNDCLLYKPEIEFYLWIEGEYTKPEKHNLRKLKRNCNRVNRKGRRLNENWKRKSFGIHYY